MTIEHFYYKAKQIKYAIVGSGKPLFLLHGYQNDSRVWDDLIPLLKTHFQLILPDLPGHGKSALVDEVNSMELMADVVKSIAKDLQITYFDLVGHSMGGYVALALAEMVPEKIRKIFLVNSHPFADNEKRLKDRKREAKLIIDGKKEVLLKSFTQLGFAESNREKLLSKIEKTIIVGLEQPDNGILADINGLMIRKSRVSLITGQRHTVTILYGENEDNFPQEEVKKLANGGTKVICVPNCSHMTPIEQPEVLANLLIKLR